MKLSKINQPSTLSQADNVSFLEANRVPKPILLSKNGTCSSREHPADAAPPRVHCYTKAGIVTWDHLTRLYQHKCIHMGRHCEHHLSITLLLLRSREGRRLINSSPGQSNVLWAKERHISDWGRLPNTVTLASRTLKKWKVFRETLEACTALPVWLQCPWLLK